MENAAGICAEVVGYAGMAFAGICVVVGWLFLRWIR